MVRIPIACTLSSTDAADRVAEWRTFLRGSVRRVERGPTVGRFLLADGDAVLVAAADLARREKACCGFFSFRLVPLPEGTWLEAEVPPDAARVLADFAALAELGT